MADSGDDGYSLDSDSGDMQDERDYDDVSEEFSRDDDDRYASLDIDAMQLDYASDSEGDTEGLGWPRHGPFLTRVLVRNDAQERVPPADVNSYKLTSVDPPMNRWTQLFHAALSGHAAELHRILVDGGEVLADADSFYPTTREFPRLFQGSEEKELRSGILHHVCDQQCAASSHLPLATGCLCFDSYAFILSHMSASNHAPHMERSLKQIIKTPVRKHTFVPECSQLSLLRRWC